MQSLLPTLATLATLILKGATKFTFHGLLIYFRIIIVNDSEPLSSMASPPMYPILFSLFLHSLLVTRYAVNYSMWPQLLFSVLPMSWYIV
jgi:hypothetical protein